MLPAEIQKKVRYLDISTRRMVNNLFTGEYHTAFKGQGMTFAEFREYVPGDDVRAISWSLTARAGRPFIKKFEEERELTLLLALDVSGSGEFGSGPYLKGEVGAYIAAVLGFSAIRNNDRVGLLLFSDEIEKYVPPKKGRRHVQRILADILSYQPKSRGTKISVALEYLLGSLKKKATIFVVSDFQDKDFAIPLRQVGRKHDTVAVMIQDPLEKEVPPLGLVDIEDAETGEIITVDLASPLVRKLLKEETERRRLLLDQEMRRAQVDRVRITSGEKFLDPLIQFFQGRHRS